MCQRVLLLLQHSPGLILCYCLVWVSSISVLTWAKPWALLLLHSAWKTRKVLTGVSYSLDRFTACLLTAQSRLLGLLIHSLLFVPANTSPTVQEVCSLLISHLPTCLLKATRKKEKSVRCWHQRVFVIMSNMLQSWYSLATISLLHYFSGYVYLSTSCATFLWFIIKIKVCLLPLAGIWMMHKNWSKGVHVRNNIKAIFSVPWQVLLMQQGFLQAVASHVHSPKTKAPLSFPMQVLGWVKQQIICRLNVSKSVSRFW